MTSNTVESFRKGWACRICGLVSRRRTRIINHVRFYHKWSDLYKRLDE